MRTFHRPRSILAVAAILFAMAPLSAQQSTAPQPGAAPFSKPGELIPIPEATPTHLAAARDLVIASGLGSSIIQVVPNLMGQINSTVTRTRPELVGDMKTVLDGLVPEFTKLPEDMLTTAARVYTALFTEQECKDALAFFKGPTGQKFVQAQPTILGNLNPAVQAWTKDLSVKMFDRVREEMKKKGHEI